MRRSWLRKKLNKLLSKRRRKINLKRMSLQQRKLLKLKRLKRPLLRRRSRKRKVHLQKKRVIMMPNMDHLKKVMMIMKLFLKI